MADTPKPNRSRVVIRTKSAPFHFDPPYASSFYEAIGRIVLLWGRFEQSLEAHVEIVIHIASRFAVKEQMQVSFLRKTDLLRRLYNRCPPLSQDAEAMRAFTKEAEIVSEDRNLIIHSNWSGFIEGDPPRLNLLNRKYKSGLSTSRLVKPTLDDLNSLAVHIEHMQLGLLGLLTDASSIHNQFVEAGKVLPPTQSGDDLTPPKR